MNENEICNILVRIQEIERLQTELRNLLPRVTNRMHIEKPAENSNLERESSSTIRFPSLLTFSGVTENSNVKKNDRSFKEIRPSMMNMKKQSLKNVTASKRASLNTISDSSAKLYFTGNKELPNILENSVKTRPRNFQSSHSRSILNDKNKSNVSTISEKIINNIPKVQDSTKSEKKKINQNSKLGNINKNKKGENEEKLSERKKKSNLSSDIGNAGTRGKIRKQSTNGTQTVRKRNNNFLTKKGKFKYDIFEKMLKRLGYCILDDKTISFIGHYSNDKTRYSTLRKVERSPFIINKGPKTEEIFSSINKVSICKDFITNEVGCSSAGDNMATICKIIKKFNGIDKVSKIFKMSFKEKGFSDTLRRNNRSTKKEDNLNNPLYLTLDKNLRSESLEAIQTRSSRRKKHPLKFLRRLCICINI
ncbi:serine/threonine-protein kinase -like isoform X2 [Vespula squamosa]|uniref:Serine/threonine-protein kinase -like isoform X2 n=1 Tax=Vespula squamosa TaxID=30214 RepID=A0ABD2AG65_VESSQ